MKMKKVILAVISFVIIFAGSICFSGKDNVVQAVDTTVVEKIMNVKCQVTAYTDENTKTPVNMRLVSSVDCLENYKEVGFEVYYNGAETAVPIRTSTVYERIEASADSGIEYNYSPKIISTDSEYFFTATLLNIHPNNFNNTFYIKPYCITTDGQTLYGVSRYVKVSDYYNKMINIPVKATETQTTGMTVDYNTTKLTQVEGYDYDGTYAHLKFQVNEGQTLPSVTTFVAKDSAGTAIDTVTHRNSTTEYTGDGVGDTSWYTEVIANDSTETEFVIATNADLYGLAKLVNVDHITFEKATVYLVADIEANKEKLVTDSTDSKYYKQWYTVDEATGDKKYQDTPTYNWTPIGHRNSSYYSFKGTFDGQMHTISGIYCNMTKVTAFTDTRYGGFFGPITSATTLRQFKLTDSYFTSNNTDFGSIAGYGAGVLEKIYSNAIVESYRERLGGMVGGVFVANVKMDECWFDGTVTNTNVNTTARRGTGGLIGDVYNVAGIQVTNCLNTGTVDASSYVAPVSSSNANVCPCVGGLVGYMEGSKASISISNSLNAGNVKINAAATTGYGFIVGYNAGTVTMSKENVYSITGEWSEDVINKSSQTANITQMSKEEFEGQSLTNLDFDTIWTAIPNHVPVLKSLKTAIIDTSWYDEDKDTFVLYDKADLFGFAELSQEHNFAGKSVKLGADITVNTGDASTWGTTAPQIEWTPIGSASLPFAGTFDGGMHTISGLYLNTNTKNSALFSVTSGTSIVKNFVLKNSYFTSNAQALGSIVGQARGLMETIKSEAIVVGSKSQVGGLVGLGLGADVEMKHCWFAGTVKNNGNAKADRGTGGLMGIMYNSGIAMIDNCLNTGIVDVTAYQFNQATSGTNIAPMAGALVGWVEAKATVTINQCLNTGKLLVYDSATGFFGLVVGYKQGSVPCTNNYSTIPTEWTDVIAAKDPYATSYTTVTVDEITGDAATSVLAKLDFTSGWLTVAGSTPVLNFGESLETVDTRWYNADATEFVLYDTGDLYGFAELVRGGTLFKDKTVKLGRNITVNEGHAKYWGSKAPKFVWTGTGSKMFAGTFDGQGYTISGIYMSATANRQGFFGITDAASVIKNFSLKNSYFVSSTWGLGSIAGQGRGQFLNIYSDAIVSCPSQFAGGLVGMGYGTNLVMKNCWFDGTVSNTGDGGTGVRGTAGILGCVYTGASVKISNCLNEGVISAKAYTYDQNTGKTDTEGNLLDPNVTPIVGGIVGYIQGSTTVEINGCLNVGEIQYSDAATGGYNPIVGYNTAGTTLIISECYATEESCEAIDLSNISSDSVTQVSATAIKGDDAKDAMKLLDWDTAWECRTNDFPMVVFTEKTTEEAVFTATEADAALLSALYSNYTLYQGELHNHADNGGSSDGNVSLTEWKTQMTEYDLDFAASLDHKQTWHINHDDWDKSLFIYGTEAGTNILEYADNKDYPGDGELHYNMIFAEQNQLKYVVQNFNDGVFNYSSFLDSSSFGNKMASGFSYPDFTRSEFANLIDAVKAQDGLFILAHPMQQGAAYFSDDALDYAFVRDYIGFEVIYTQLNCGNTRTNYKAWKELLAAGKRLWATSGSDSHDNLDSKTLTSVYADAAEKAKGNLVSYMKDGNFTAGSVGIQMCVGNTPMGGHCDFTNQRVVIDVGEFHTSIDDSHKYRIDVMNENGIVYSQSLNVDATTKIPTNGKIAFNAEECDFYRVVIYDMTDGYRIAYGNPIWNDK